MSRLLKSRFHSLRKNGIRLPKQYREWLSFSDGGELFLPAGVQFHGVAHRPLIDVSEDRRPGDNYIVVGVLCAGDTLLYEKGSDKFAVYFPEEGELDENLIYEDFYDFLTNLYDLLGIEDEE